MITGRRRAGRTKVVIVELKQWSESRRSEEGRDRLGTPGGRGRDARGPTPRTRPGPTPACSRTSTRPYRKADRRCSPAPTCTTTPATARSTHPRYRDHLAAPVFVRAMRRSCRPSSTSTCATATVAGPVTKSTTGASGRRRCWPTQSQGCCRASQEFVLIDDQKVVFETLLQAERRPAQRKQVRDRAGRAGYRQVGGRHQPARRADRARAQCPLRDQERRAARRLRGQAGGHVHEVAHYQSVQRSAPSWRRRPTPSTR